MKKYVAFYPLILVLLVACAGKQVRDLDAEELKNLQQLDLDLGSTEGMNALQGGAVQAVILSHTIEIDACYKKALKHNPKLEGNVTTDFTILQNGKLATFKIKKTTLHSKLVEACVARIFRKMDFPTGSQPMDVIYTIKFDKEKDDPIYVPEKNLNVPVIPIVN